MEKQLISPQNIDNGLKELIKRYPGLRRGYVDGVMENLKGIPGAKKYGRNQIMRVVNDKVPLNYHSRVIKAAFHKMCEGIVPVEELI